MSRAALSIHQILLTIYRNIGQLTSVQFAIRGTGSIARAIGQEKAQAAVDSQKDMDLGAVQVCKLCGYTVEGMAPDKCPLCNADRDKFVSFDPSRAV